MQLTLSRTLLIHALILIGVGGAIVAYRQVHVKPVQVEEMPEPTPEDMAEIARLTEVVRMSRYGHQGVDFVKSCRDLIALQERYLVPEHPEIMSNREALASFLEQYGRCADAEAECAIVLEILQRVMGKDDAYTMVWQEKCGELRRRMAKLAVDEQSIRELWKKREQLLGADDPETLIHCFNLASCLDDLGKLQEALEFAKRAEELQIKIFGAEHTDTPVYENLRRNIEASLKQQPVK